MLGGSKYVENLIETGSPQGQAGNDVTRSSSLRASTERTMWGFVDLPGFGGTLPAEITQRGHDWVWPAGEDPFNDTYVSEDGIGYGPIGLLLFLPLLAWFALAPSSPPCRRVIAVAAGSFIVAYIVVIEPDAFAMHTMVTGVVARRAAARMGGRARLVRHVVAAVAVAFLIPVLFQNQKKPLLPDSSSA